MTDDAVPAHSGAVPETYARHIPTPKRKPRTWMLGSSVLLGVGAVFLLGYLPQRRQRAELLSSAAARANELPSVSWVQPGRAQPEQTVELPGSVQGLNETLIYARVDGYLARFLADLGDRVTEGQVLAELDTPEISQEYLQAQHDLAQAQASVSRAEAERDYAAANLRRYRALAEGLTSREELEQKETAARLAEASVRVAEAARDAQRANLARLKSRKAFSTVRAPFAGTITARTVERGALVSAGRSSPLFKLAALETVRVFVQVPQPHVAGVQRGAAASVSVHEYPRETFVGTVTRTADALDSSTRTMTVEIHVPNPERKLLPGMYSSVSIPLTRDDAARIQLFTVPASALVVSEHGVQVASVSDDHRVHLIDVVVERDRGTDIEIASGLRGDEQIVTNLSPALQEGSRVHAVAKKPASAGPAK